MVQASLPRFILRLGLGLAAGLLAASPAAACGCGKFESAANLALYEQQWASLGWLYLLLAALLAGAGCIALWLSGFRRARPLLTAALLSALILASYIVAYQASLRLARQDSLLDYRDPLGSHFFLASVVLPALLGSLLLAVMTLITRQSRSRKCFVLTALATSTLWNVLGLALAAITFRLLGLQSEHALNLSWWASALGLSTLVSYRMAVE